MQILLIEDDEGIREVFKLILEAEAPFEKLVVGAAASGAEALKLLETFSPDMILLDLTLPDEHGFDLFSKIRAQKAFSDIPVVAVTAHNQRELEKKASELGFAGFITKPFDFEQTLFPLLRELGKRIKAKHHAA